MRPARGACMLLALAWGFAIAGCDSLLDVKTDVVTPEATANADGAEALRLAAWNRLAQTLTGTASGSTGLITVSGVMSDEMIVTSARPGLEAIDSRVVDANNEQTYATAQFQRLSQTRLFTRQAIEGLQAYAPQRRAAIAQMFAARAYAEILLGEHFCSGIPLSEIEAGRPVHGAPLTNEQVFTRALAHADSALAQAADNEQMANLARVARGRALLNLGRFAEAAAAVSPVPTGFIYNLEFSAAASALNNGLTVWMNQTRIFSVANNKGTNGLNYIAAADPRVVTVPGGMGQDGLNPATVLPKYASAAAPVPLASGIEARLIQAEALLRNGDAPGALTVLNTLRATVPGLPALEDAGTAAARQDQLFRERAFWLYGTATRLGDMRRLVRQYDRSQATVFPVGAYFRGGNFGTEVTLPIPLSEENNPLSTGCIARGA